MRLETIEVDNWRFPGRVTWSPATEGVTWLAGRNGAGKSTLLDALGFMADLLHHPQDALKGGLRGASARPDHVQPFTRFLGDPTQPAQWRLTFTIEGVRWRYALHLQPSAHGFVIGAETLQRHLKDDLWTECLEVAQGAARWLQRSEHPGDTQVLMEPVQPPLGAPLIAQVDPRNPAHTPLHAPARALRGIWLLRLDPYLMRGADPEPPATSGPPRRHGQDLWARLAARLRQAGQEAARDVAEVMGWLEVSASDGEVAAGALRFRESETRWLGIDHASDGESVLIALHLLSLLPPDDLTVLLLDEPAVQLDVLTLDHLVVLLEELAEQRQVIAATQALRALDQVDRSQVLRVEREPGQPPRVTRLDEDAHKAQISGLYKPGMAVERLWWVEDSGGSDEQE